MYQKEVEETRCLWNKLADDWLIQVGMKVTVIVS